MTNDDEHRTPYADDALSVQNGTQPEEIQEFVIRRATNPIQVDGLVVWNFNNHTVNKVALREQADDFLHTEYVIPYQASGVWAYMSTILPEFIREAEILIYNQNRGMYSPYPNYIRHSDEKSNQDVRERIDERVRGELL